MPARATRWTPAASPTTAGCRCSRSWASRTPTSRPTQPPGATYDVEWVDIDDPAPDVPVHAGPDRADHQQRRDLLRRQPGPGAGRRVLLPPRGRGLRRRRRLLHLDAGRRARRRPASDRSPTATATAAARSGRTDTAVAEAAARLPVARAGRRSTSRTTSPTSPRGTLVLCEDNINDNYLRGLTRQRAAVRHRPEPPASASTGAPRFERRVRRGDLQPRRPDAVRQHPGVARA